MASEPTVFVIDDDPMVRESLRSLLESAGLRVEVFDAPIHFLEVGADARAGCLLLDVQMPTMSGLDFQEMLSAQKCQMPVIVITGHGEVPMAVRAMRHGAIDFVEKPYDEAVLLDRVHYAIELDGERRASAQRLEGIQIKLSRLTPREREVMQLVVQGNANKQIAHALGISPKTVEIHRANVMRKSEAGSVAELVRMSDEVRAE